MHAPQGTQQAVLDRFAAAADPAMRDPETVKKLKAQGIEPVGGTRAGFEKFVDAERSRPGAIVKAAGMKEDLCADHRHPCHSGLPINSSIQHHSRQPMSTRKQLRSLVEARSGLRLQRRVAATMRGSRPLN